MRPCVAGALDLAEVDAEFARQLAHRRAGVGEREGGFVDAAAGGALPRPRRGGAGAARAAAPAAAAAARRAGASPVASDRITEPSLTLSPTLTRIACTTPDSGAGTSIVALSDSSETSGSSAFTVSPTLTKISMTGTSLKSPMSGTRTSATPAGALTGDGGALTLGLAASAGAAAAARRPRLRTP